MKASITYNELKATAEHIQKVTGLRVDAHFCYGSYGYYLFDKWNNTVYYTGLGTKQLTYERLMAFYNGYVICKQIIEQENEFKQIVEQEERG